ncbi:MAG: glycosyltransferase [Actinobacteria bacterium]|uniref:Unannotated protein n=1 Tax=freshwater metagenome TaxID=449393 RepID=A0A6J6VDV3_9ZZZZ|nr:glycosyltransferase [Actinomycetota bacterium]
MSDWIYRVPEASTTLVEAEQPTFSVVIAVYNAAEFIGDALDSCFAQTVAPLEILVVDDGSTDDLDAALAPYLERIRLIRQPNGGESIAKNAGAGAATGDYVLLLDADDVAHPQRIEAVESLAVKRPDLAIITHDDAMTQDGVLLRNYFGDDRIFVTVDQREAIVRGCFIVNPAVRRDVWLAHRGYDESIRISADWDLWIRIILSGGLAGMVDAPLVEYRQWSGSLTANVVAATLGSIAVLEKTRSRSDLTATERMIIEVQLRHYRSRLARAAIISGDTRAREFLVAVVRDSGEAAGSRIRAALAALSPRIAKKRVRNQ